MARKKTAPAVVGEGPRVGRRALSTHKRRSSWFQARAAWPIREASVEELVRERKRMPRPVPPAAPTPQAQWQCVGPTNIGGRVTSIIAHPADPNRIWVGAAGGGV
ncbi:MAG: hypothetical protein LAP85_27475 [Acidobacteriia bacterium]|nr:hypothetical protein [Terriglobia bacterium]